MSLVLVSGVHRFIQYSYYLKRMIIVKPLTFVAKNERERMITKLLNCTQIIQSSESTERDQNKLYFQLTIPPGGAA